MDCETHGVSSCADLFVVQSLAVSHVASDTIGQTHQNSPYSSQQLPPYSEVTYQSSNEGQPGASNMGYVLAPTHQHAPSHIRTHGHSRSHSMPQASQHNQHNPHHHAANHGGIPVESAIASCSSSQLSDGEQKIQPDMIGLEEYYWNVYPQQVVYSAGQPQQHVQQYYTQDASNGFPMQGDDGVVGGVIRRLWQHNV